MCGPPATAAQSLGSWRAGYDGAGLDGPPGDHRAGPLAHPAIRACWCIPQLALTPERLPLGLLAQQVWARDPATSASAPPQAAADRGEGKSEVADQCGGGARGPHRCPQTATLCASATAKLTSMTCSCRSAPRGWTWLVRAAVEPPGGPSGALPVDQSGGPTGGCHPDGMGTRAACSRPARPRSPSGGVWCCWGRPRTRTAEKNCPVWRSGPSRR